MREHDTQNTFTRRRFLGLAGSAAVTAIAGGFAISESAAAQQPEAAAPYTPEALIESSLLAAETSGEAKGSHAEPIDYAGAAVFAKGLYELSPKGRGHIGATEYAALGGLICAKYAMGDEETKHHIKAELKASIQALAIIGSTSTVAQGLKIDLEKAYHADTHSDLPTPDKVAIATMLASTVSPVGTTVASAASLTEEAQTIARDVGRIKGQPEGEMDKDTVSVLVDHVSNRSGFILFGDPPWIALVEKYGFSAAVKYQAETMWPLALSSLISANVKINQTILAEQGLTGIQLRQESVKQSLGAIARNLPFLIRANMQTLKNVGRYAGQKEQDIRGFQLEIGKVLMEKAKNAVTLLSSKDTFNLPLHDDEYSSRVTDHMPALDAIEEDFSHFVEALDTEDNPVSHDVIDHYLTEGDFDGLTEYLNQHNVTQAAPLVETLRALESQKANEFIQSGRSGVSKAVMRLAPGFAASIYGRLNLHRTHHALGPQLTDVGNVFPFQAASVIFLTPIFHDGYERLESAISDNPNVTAENRSVVLDAAGFAAFDAFSGVADNYVAAKIGLDVFPDRPALVLAASIGGGTKLAISNMANPTLVPLGEYSLADSARRAHKTLPQDVLAFAYAEGVERLIAPTGILTIPKPKAGAASGH